MNSLKKLMWGLAAVFIFTTTLLGIFKASPVSAKTGGFTASDVQNATVHWVDYTHIYLTFASSSRRVDMFNSGNPGSSSAIFVDLTSSVYAGQSPDHFCRPQNPTNGLIQSQVQLLTPVDSNGNPVPGTKATVDNQFNNQNMFFTGSSVADCTPHYVSYKPIYPNLQVQDFNPPDSGLKTVTDKITDIHFKDGYTIVLTYDGKTYTYFDSHPFDDNPNYADQDQPFSGKGTSGINLTINSFDDLNKSSVPASIDVVYLTQTSSGSKYVHKTIHRNIDNPGQAATQLFSWGGGDIKTPDSSGTNLDLKQFPSDKGLYFQDINDHCGGGGGGSGSYILWLTSEGAKSGKLYRLANDPSGNSNLKLDNTKFPTCKLQPDSPITGWNKRDVLIAGAQTDGTGGTTADQNGNNNSDNCYGIGSSLGGSNLNWILCPIIAGLSTAANDANGFVQGQLHIDIKANIDNDSIHRAWAVFRDLVSALLVILLLVMVISQAAGGAMFEAYTIKKVLPKLVVAIILMQISWQLCIWTVDLFNQIGQGLADLISAPFGGQSALDLPALMNHLNPGWAIILGSGGSIVLGLLSFMAVWLFWPWLLIGGFLAFMAVVAAMATLLIRNALIIIAIIVAPFALLAWAAPGSGPDKFWKFWFSNFSKALMLFPLVVFIIFGGRIFAWTAGGLGKAGPLDALMVFAGYFGPYFFLPKTFKWGGSILAAANRGITENGAFKGIRSKGLAFGKEIDKQWRGSNTRSGAFRYNPNDPRKFRVVPRRLSAGFKRKTDENGNETDEIEKFFGIPKPAIKAYNAVKKVRKDAAEQKLRENGVDFYRMQSNGALVPRMDNDGNFLDKYGKVVDPNKFGHLGYNGETGEYFKRSFKGLPTFEGRVVGRIVSGHILPTARDRAKAIQYGAEWAEDMNKLAYIYAHRKFQEANDKGYTDHNGKHYTKGVAAAKAAIMDAAGDASMDGRVAKLAIDDLMKTKSWPEIGSLRITTPGKNKGKLVYETPEWESYIAENPELYPEVQRNLYVAVPDVMQKSYRTRTKEDAEILERAKKGQDKKDAGIVEGTRFSHADRLGYALAQRMAPEAVAGQKEEFFAYAYNSLVEELGDRQRGIAGRADQTAAQETARDVASYMAGQLEQMVYQGTDGASLLGRLSSGNMRLSLNNFFNKAKEAGFVNPDTGEAFSIEYFIDQNRRFVSDGMGAVTLKVPPPKLHYSNQEGASGDSDGGEENGTSGVTVSSTPRDPGGGGAHRGSGSASGAPAADPGFGGTRDAFPGEVTSTPIAQQQAGATGELTVNHVKALTDAAQAMSEAAGELSTTGREMRRSIAAQTEATRRLGQSQESRQFEQWSPEPLSPPPKDSGDE